MSTLAEIESLYDSGQIATALQKTDERLAENPTGEELQSLLVRKAWCHYRRQEYPQTYDCCLRAIHAPKAQECLAYLYAYAQGFKDDQKLMAIAAKIGDNVNVANALVIRARDPDSTLTHEQVEAYTKRYQQNEVAVANLYHNAARFFLAKARDAVDLGIALDYIEWAIRRYGPENNWHHRAAAHKWKSDIHRKMGWLVDARTAAEESLRLWQKQVELDPTNEGFKKNLINAQELVQELKIVQEISEPTIS